ncbi:hypothetical protein [Gelidibacter salicanalis]|uniref:Uncharacterized protein n=1 Tax=Gelidibacter salicanalis TaxID=291193 RepID=A0A934KRA4_9FLAO|nr:hypothetical protein [Gelidibacter salicanalis]MBJ7879198.1 hypothetical protein [Gelidibacter salicanalis]
MLTNNSKLAIAMSQSFREVFDQVLNDYIYLLDPPAHFDMAIDSVLVGHLMYYSEGFYKENLFDVDTKNAVLNHIYTSNINKIKDAVSDPWTLLLGNPHGNLHSEKLRGFIVQDYIRLSEDVNKSKYIIQTLIQDSYEEIVRFTNPLFGNPSKMLPDQFYINCFIHPLPSLNYDDILYNARPDMIKEHSNIIFNNLLSETSNFIAGFLNEIDAK